MEKGKNGELNVKFRSSSISFHALGYWLFGKIPAKLFPFSRLIQREIYRAYLKVNYIIYVSSMFFWSVVSFILASFSSFIIFTFILPDVALPRLRIPLLSLELPPPEEAVHPIVFYSLLIGFLVSVVVFLIFVFYPSYRASNLKRKIEKNLVYAVNYMAILSSAGATTEEIFSSLAKTGEIFGVEESARSIIKRVEFLGEDVITAIDEESRRTPSKDYATFLQGYITTVQTGGSREAYFSAMAEKFIDLKRNYLRKIIDTLDLATETFLILLIVFPFFMIVSLSIMGSVGGEVFGFSPTTLTILITYILTPLMGISILLFLYAILSGW